MSLSVYQCKLESVHHAYAISRFHPSVSHEGLGGSAGKCETWSPRPAARIAHSPQNNIWLSNEPSSQFQVRALKVPPRASLPVHLSTSSASAALPVKTSQARLGPRLLRYPSFLASQITRRATAPREPITPSIDGTNVLRNEPYDRPSVGLCTRSGVLVVWP